MAQEVAEATHGRLCSGIVAFVDLKLGPDAVEPALRALVERHPTVRGIRHALAWTVPEHTIMCAKHAGKDVAYDVQFRGAFALLNRFGLSFDCWLYHTNLPAFKDLALAFPDTTMVCDHVGQPLGLAHGRDEARTVWLGAIADLARSCPNVVVKLSGLGMRCGGFGFDERKTPPSSTELAEVWKEYVLHCVEHFGVSRCMFASNFPVDKVSGSYTATFNAFKIICRDAGFTAAQKQQLFFDTAARVYRL
jgi:predicted TIM-barrel fold metal-dependent hydrolase